MMNKRIKFLSILLISLIYISFIIDPRPMKKIEYVILILPIVFSISIAIYVKIKK
ncbi:MAG: hypothetical protein N4A68_14325 [Maledivibacter sp.]|jgi:hypothetical protein|nr:hypothetical protein [Maledivibacter sp.]